MFNDFYVYALYYPANDSIFYIGKGRKSRIDVSARLSKRPRDKNYFKFNALKIIYSAGEVPVKRKLYENLTEEDSLKIESNLIEQYGRICDGSGILTNIAKNSTKSNTGWNPTKETRAKWSLQRKDKTQSQDHIDARVEKISGKRRTNKQKYTCLLAYLNHNSSVREHVYTILQLFNTGKFIQTIHNISGIDKEIISKVIKYSKLYQAALNNEEYHDDLYLKIAGPSFQKISHILKDRHFYIKCIDLIFLNIHINEIVLTLGTTHTRVRYIMNNISEIKEILNTYE